MANVSTTTADVVVVGGGGTGLAAAIEARSLGRSVILLEKNPRVGGTTAWSVGSITATNTPHQLAAGIQDAPAHHAEDMVRFIGHDPRFANGVAAPAESAALRRLLADNSPDTIRWLMDKGVVFFGPMPELPHRKPRMHNIVPNSRAYIYHLERHARKTGVDIRVNARAQRLVRDDRRVIGVECSGADGTLTQYLTRGVVVLASGDYSANPEMKAQYISEQAARIGPINPTSTGDGQRMATEIGARVLNGHLSFYSLRFPAPAQRPLVQRIPPWPVVTRSIVWALKHLPQWLLRPVVLGYVTTFLVPETKMFNEGAIFVNKAGQRFTDELDKPDMALLDQPGQCAFAIMDDAVAHKFSQWPYYISTAPGVAFAYLNDYRRNRPDVYKRADSLPALAQLLGMPADALMATVENYNRDIAGKSGGKRPAIGAAPYHALGPIMNLMGFTDGGLAINTQLEVLDSNDQPIPGLLAAGSAGQGGLLLLGHGHHLGWGFTSGRLAGRNAAYRVTNDDLPQANSPAPTSQTSQT